MKYVNSILLLLTLLQTNYAQEIYLKTDPDDAYVMKGDSLIGHTPLFIPQLFQSISLMKPGYASEDVKLSSYDGMPVKLKFVGKQNSQPFYEKSAFRIFMLSSVALGTITAYYKIKADNKFEDFKATGTPSLLNETHRYDLISGLSFAALQINFGLLIYYLLIY
jgi:hypothetical protein